MTAFLLGLFEAGYGPPPQRLSLWRKAASRLQYRGPDGCCSVDLVTARLVAGNRLLGHRSRVAPQPFQDPESGVWILFDGRLDAPLQQARSLGLSGRSGVAADVQLVAAAYRRLGSDFAARLEGEYCAVVYDPQRRRLVASRDPLGSRALFWSAGPTGMLLSNELPAIHAVAEPRGLDDRAIADYLMHGFFGFFDKSRTPFASIHALEPGFRLVAEGGQVRLDRVRRFADLIRRTRSPRSADIPAAFNAVFQEAVADRLEASSALIPLSGGLDSSTIAAHCAAVAHSGRCSTALLAVTGTVTGDDSEWEMAAATASELGLTHCRTQVSNQDLFPSHGATWFPTTFFYHADRFDQPALAGCDLLLTGSAGDSSLASSHSSILSLLRGFGLRSTAHAWRCARAQQRRLALGSGLGRLTHPQARARSRLVSPHPFPNWLAPGLIESAELAERWHQNLQWMPAESLDPIHPEPQFWLQWGNWFGGCYRVGLEQTPPEWTDPFLDARVLSFIFSVPPEPWTQQKHLLRQAGRGKLPDAVLRRPKVPAGNFIARFERARDRAVLDQWASSTELEAFVRRDKVPPIDILREADVGYLNLRPMMLQRWLSGLEDW